MPSPDEAVYWIDQQGNQIGPEPFGTLTQRVEYGQVPPSTAVWWNGAPDWMRYSDVPPVTPPAAVAPVAPAFAAPVADFAPPVEAAPIADFAPPTEAAPMFDTVPVVAEAMPQFQAPAVFEPEPVPEPVSAPEPEPVPEPVSEPTPEPVFEATPADPVSRLLMQGISDQELDDEFIGLVARSWELYKDTEHARSIDEVFLGGVITAMVDSGFLLIDVDTAGAMPYVDPALAGTTVTTNAVTLPNPEHRLRFEEPTSKARVTMSVEHLTADAATAKLIGHRANTVIGYGERVPNFSQVGQAIRQEMASAFIASPEPGTVSFDADMSSGYVYAQIDLLLELDRYVSDELAIDHELLRRHIASVVYTMQTFVRARFSN